MNANGFNFDANIKDYSSNQITIYPILVHQDFQFSMPGVNHYLNELFVENMKAVEIPFKVEPVLLVNLEVLLDMAICSKDLSYLMSAVHDYYQFLGDHNLRFQKYGLKNDFLKSHLSFDQLYNTTFIKNLDNPKSIKPHLNKLLALAKISLEDFKRPL